MIECNHILLCWPMFNDQFWNTCSPRQNPGRMSSECWYLNHCRIADERAAHVRTWNEGEAHKQKRQSLSVKSFVTHWQGYSRSQIIYVKRIMSLHYLVWLWANNLYLSLSSQSIKMNSIVLTLNLLRDTNFLHQEIQNALVLCERVKYEYSSILQQEIIAAQLKLKLVKSKAQDFLMFWWWGRERNYNRTFK